ncbi:hypothetical protein [Cupriavidus lacunae]|uniref:hypothetical protein n=1 Tax=Cupriavidus lacunae TaxID=2666307 RepID=UPI001374A319|nr:hypothetical protein [Cupriavidus lacunae]
MRSDMEAGALGQGLSAAEVLAAQWKAALDLIAPKLEQELGAFGGISVVVNDQNSTAGNLGITPLRGSRR